MAVSLLLVLAITVAGCTSEDDPADVGLPRRKAAELSEATDRTMRSWSEPTADGAARTLDYLESDEGRAITRFVARVERAEEELDDRALTDGCASLASEWDDALPIDRLYGQLERLGDEPLADAVSEQADSIQSMFDACQGGDRKAARDFARVALGWHNVYQLRLEQLEEAR